MADARELDAAAVLQIGRLTRNDASHASGRKIERDSCSTI
jgi:hypothetical protein